MIGRVQANGADDYAEVRKFQDGLKFVPLSQYKIVIIELLKEKSIDLLI